MSEKPAIEGGKPVRDEFLSFARPSIGEAEISEVEKTLRSGWLTRGPKTQEFEKRLGEYLGTRYCIAVSSCTAALHLSLIAAGLGAGDEVITTPFTFAATANTIVHTGATPVFADILPDTLNIDPQKIKQALTGKTKAIVPVHYGGQPCKMGEIKEIAKEHDLIVIEDAAHAIGAEYKGKKIGTISDFTAFSFYPTKNMTTGEGGAVTAEDGGHSEKIRVMSLHGISKDAWKRYSDRGNWYYEVLDAGYKYNMTDLQASLGLHQLDVLDAGIAKREEISREYDKAFSELPEITTPHVKDDVKHARHLYPILIDGSKLKIGRDKFIEALGAENMGTSVHFIPLHLHPFYRERLGLKKGMFPVAEETYSSLISLPIYPAMEDTDTRDVIQAVEKIVGYYRK